MHMLWNDRYSKSSLHTSPYAGPWGPALSLCEPQPCGPYEHKPWWLSKWDVLGAHLSGAGLRSGVWGSDPVLLKKEPGPVSFLLSKCILPHSGGVCGEIVSQPLVSISFFSCLPNEGVVAQQIFGFLSEEPVPNVAADRVCLWEKVSSGSSFAATLNWNPAFILIDFNCYI